MTLIFSKTNEMRFISHLDLMRLFQRALRREELPFELTKGFNKRPRMSMKRALKLGLASENEEATFYLKETIAPEDFKLRFQKQLPDGILVKEAKVSEA